MGNLQDNTTPTASGNKADTLCVLAGILSEFWEENRPEFWGYPTPYRNNLAGFTDWIEEKVSDLVKENPDDK